MTSYYEGLPIYRAGADLHAAAYRDRVVQHLLHRLLELGSLGVGLGEAVLLVQVVAHVERPRVWVDVV